jgi:small GTP-binding protein
VLKLVVVGDGGVGKTTLIHRYLTDIYLDQRMTVGSGFATRNIEIDGVTIVLSIWDFAGEQRFRFLMPKYCLGAHGCLLAFDLTRQVTFFHLDDWLKLVREHAGQIPILLVGTKLDISPLSRTEAEAYVTVHGLNGYIETSAKENVGVHEVFQLVADLMWARIAYAEVPARVPEPAKVVDREVSQGPPDAQPLDCATTPSAPSADAGHENKNAD